MAKTVETPALKKKQLSTVTKKFKFLEITKFKFVVFVRPKCKLNYIYLETFTGLFKISDIKTLNQINHKILSTFKFNYSDLTHL